MSDQKVDEVMVLRIAIDDVEDLLREFRVLGMEDPEPLISQLNALKTMLEAAEERQELMKEAGSRCRCGRCRRCVLEFHSYAIDCMVEARDDHIRSTVWVGVSALILVSTFAFMAWVSEILVAVECWP
jgi:hypothetical protein